MNRRTYLTVFATISLVAALSVVSLLTGCSSSSSAPPPPPTIVVTATSGVTQSAAINTAVAGSAYAALVATVTSNGSPDSGASVVFTAPTTGASCTFASTGTNTETDTTGSNGEATSSVCTANGTVGGYTVAATVTGATAPANFSLTNLGWNNYVYYWSGQEVPNSNNGDLVDYYAVAGAVQIDTNGDVLGGEQDYNDAFGITSPGEPNTPDTIALADGALVVSATTGLGTLTLTSSNADVGVNGVETLAVQFVNSNHAFITQFDGSATSSGSFDLQTGGAPGNFAFTMTGINPNYDSVAFGGVLSVASGVITGTMDVNDSDGGVLTGTTVNASVGTADGFGRAVVTGFTNPTLSGTPAITLASYSVGPEAVRIIDVDTTDSAVGSAYGQGTNGTGASAASLCTSAGSLAPCVFTTFGQWTTQYGTVGQFTTDGVSLITGGQADDNELDTPLQSVASAISGSYTVGTNGYASISLTGDGDVTLLGLYLTDPMLNLNDPNNTTTDLGGALVIDLDSSTTGTSGVPLPGGMGVITPQTDTTATDFSGTYVAGFQDYNAFNANCGGCEFDMIALFSMTSGTFSTTGADDSDPLDTISGKESTGDSYTSIPLSVSAGYFSMSSANTPANPLAATIDSLTGSFDADIYQASATTLYWLNFDDDSVFLGPIEAQGSLSAVPLIKGPGVRNVKNPKNSQTRKIW